jgi:hypothetical protein
MSLKAIHISMLDCIKKLDDYTQVRPSLLKTPKAIVYGDEGFKSYLRGFLELIRKYFIKHSIKDGFFLHYEAIQSQHYMGLIDEEHVPFIVELAKFRNDFAHGYEVPTFEEMYAFYLENSNLFISISNKVREKI